jgi:hypothetical protein
MIKLNLLGSRRALHRIYGLEVICWLNFSYDVVDIQSFGKRLNFIPDVIGVWLVLRLRVNLKDFT